MNKENFFAIIATIFAVMCIGATAYCTIVNYTQINLVRLIASVIVCVPICISMWMDFLDERNPKENF